MTLIRKLTAHCDADGCEAVQEVRPNTTQPFIDLAKKGWTAVIAEAPSYDILTHCPDHKDQAPS